MNWEKPNAQTSIPNDQKEIQNNPNQEETGEEEIHQKEGGQEKTKSLFNSQNSCEKVCGLQRHWKEQQGG